MYTVDPDAAAAAGVAAEAAAPAWWFVLFCILFVGEDMAVSILYLSKDLVRHWGPRQVYETFVRWTSVGRLTDARRTSDGRPTDIRGTCVGRPTDVSRTSVGRPLDVGTVQLIQYATITTDHYKFSDDNLDPASAVHDPP